MACVNFVGLVREGPEWVQQALTPNTLLTRAPSVNSDQALPRGDVRASDLPRVLEPSGSPSLLCRPGTCWRVRVLLVGHPPDERYSQAEHQDARHDQREDRRSEV